MDSNLLRIAATAVAIAVLEEEKVDRRGRKRSCWARHWLRRREEGRGIYSMLMDELLPEDPNEFRNFLRMDKACFDKLLSLIHDNIRHEDTVMRESISPSRRLAVTLRFLATGETYKSLSFSHRISVPSISHIVVEVCKAIKTALRDKYLKAPTTEGEWLEIAEKFDELWQFPNCLGAMDGKHIAFAPPRSAGSMYYNYKKFNSVVLLAVVDAKYRFQLIDIGCNGRVSDGGVFQQSKISSALRENWLRVPQEKVLKNSDITVPYVIVADDAFRLLPYIMKPYKDCKDDIKKKVTNYRISRSRRTVENAFGILSNRYRILLTTIKLSVDKVELIVEILCILHNFLIDERDSGYMSPRDIEDTESCTVVEGSWRAGDQLNGIHQQMGNRTGREAKEIRDKFCEYFNTTGFVHWQWEAVKKYNF